jgi:hypothetical protein
MNPKPEAPIRLVEVDTLLKAVDRFALCEGGRPVEARGGHGHDRP